MQAQRRYVWALLSACVGASGMRSACKDAAVAASAARVTAQRMNHNSAPQPQQPAEAPMRARRLL